MIEESEPDKPEASKNSAEINNQTRPLSLIEPAEDSKAKGGTPGRTRWNWEQELLYYRFAKVNKDRLSKSIFTKKYNKFSKMAEFISSKSVTQCRSHHQKTIQKHTTLDNYLQHFQTHFKNKTDKLTRSVGVQADLSQSPQPPQPELTSSKKGHLKAGSIHRKVEMETSK